MKLQEATKRELVEWESNEENWLGFLDDLTENGVTAVSTLVKGNCWSFAAFKRYVRATPERKAAYDEALKDYAEKMMLDTIAIADAATPENVQVAKLRGDVRARLAPKLDRKWADKDYLDGAGVKIEIVTFDFENALAAANNNEKLVVDASPSPE